MSPSKVVCDSVPRYGTQAGVVGDEKVGQRKLATG